MFARTKPERSRNVAQRYQSDTVVSLAMTLRLTPEEHEALRRRAQDDGISMQDAARQAVREYVNMAGHRDRVGSAGTKVMQAHADALRRLGE
jgi:hypothetical protein